jgi:hypothetical protein
MRPVFAGGFPASKNLLMMEGQALVVFFIFEQIFPEIFKSSEGRAFAVYHLSVTHTHINTFITHTAKT